MPQPRGPGLWALDLCGLLASSGHFKSFHVVLQRRRRRCGRPPAGSCTAGERAILAARLRACGPPHSSRLRSWSKGCCRKPAQRAGIRWWTKVAAATAAALPIFPHSLATLRILPAGLYIHNNKTRRHMQCNELVAKVASMVGAAPKRAQWVVQYWAYTRRISPLHRKVVQAMKASCNDMTTQRELK